ncbi:MAG: M23 family metallopeptidase, partial [Kordiimonadaceae bacterium]|nr:M23 family metallopeptidase [Kordiimonadaceae bacterium]
MQIALSTAAAGCLIWGIITSYAFLARDLLLEEKNTAILNIAADYQNLSNDFSSMELEIERRTKQLEERQTFLEEVVGEKSQGQKNVDLDTEADIKGNPNEDMLKDTADGTLQHTAVSLFQGFLNNTGAEKILTTAERRTLLLSRLENAENRQSVLAASLLGQVRHELAQINSVIKPTSLTSEDLIRQSVGDASAMGGPYSPEAGFEPVFREGDHLNYTNLLDQWQRLEIAVNVLNSFPIGIPAEKYYVSSRFGRRRDPLKKKWANHPGLDLAGWTGTAIYATAAGKVVHAGWFGPYGRMVEIEHSNGFKTRYGHMKKVRVKKGELVSIGARVGDMGKTGRTTGTHLHYEIWFDGKVRDPAPFLSLIHI